MSKRHLLMTLLFALCCLSGVAAAQDELPPVELDYYFIGWNVTDLQLVEDRVNEIVQPQINATVNLNLIEWGSYAERMRLIAASGEQCDLMFLNAQWNPYPPMVANGALLPLDDLLPEYAPKLWASIPEDMWDAVRVNGQIYAAINQGLQALAYGIWLRVDLMEQYGFDWEAADSYEDVGELLAAIAEDQPDIKVFSAAGTPHGRLWFPQAWGVDPIGSPNNMLGIRIDDESLTVHNATEMEEYRQAAELTREWYTSGYFPADPPSSGDIIAARSAGMVSGMIWNNIPGVDYFVATGEYGGREVRQLVLTDPVMTTDTVANSLTGVCATSPNPERAVMLIELLNSDPYLLTTLVRGVEGVHWVWVDEEQNLAGLPEGATPDEINTAYRAPDWIFGSKFNLAYGHPSEIGAYEQIQALNESAIRSVALGFVADYEPVRTEVAQVQAAHQQYCEPVERGMVDIETGLAECQARLEEAGIDAIVTEIQNQVNAWAESR